MTSKRRRKAPRSKSQQKPASNPGKFFHRYQRASATPWREERPDLSRATLFFQPAEEQGGVPRYIYAYLGVTGWNGLSISAQLAEQLPEEVIAASGNGEGRYFVSGEGDCLIWIWLWEQMYSHCSQVPGQDWAQLSPVPASVWFSNDMLNTWHQRMRQRYPELYARTFPNVA